MDENSRRKALVVIAMGLMMFYVQALLLKVQAISPSSDLSPASLPPRLADDDHHTHPNPSFDKLSSFLENVLDFSDCLGRCTRRHCYNLKRPAVSECRLSCLENCLTLYFP